MTIRIVITGMGTLNPLGNTVDETWGNIKAGKSGIGRITRYDATLTETQIGGEIKNFDPAQCLGHKEARRMDRFAQWAVVCALDAVTQAQYRITPENTFDTAVMIGSGVGGSYALSETFETIFTKGIDKIRPTAFPAVIPSMASAQPAIFLGIKGINFGVSAACATGNVSIGEGAALIRRGDAEVVLVGATDAVLIPASVGGLNAMRTLTTRNDEPEKASRPFDATRDGFVPSEGAAVLVLESLEHAQARGAEILAEVVGYGASCDASHITAPDSSGDAVCYAMRRALSKADLTVNDIDYINAHGTSTVLNDLHETRAIKRVFGEQAYKVPISSTKSMLGHGMCATGAVEAVLCVMALRDGVIPPTINLEHPDPECDLDYVPNVARNADLRYVMSNSFGFGGHNAVVIFKRWDG
ncbi:MAG: beta-ketoacyl-ACP synthase II [Chloroflexota bacterium]